MTCTAARCSPSVDPRYRSVVASALPRFTGPAQARQRMRLAAALGLLAIAATPELPTLLDPASRVEHRVEEAEEATTKARAAIRSARQLGVVDDRQLDALERRLDAAAGRSSHAITEAPRHEREAVSSTIDPSPREL